MRTKLTKTHRSFVRDTSRGTPGFAVPQTSASSAIFWSFATSEMGPLTPCKTYRRVAQALTSTMRKPAGAELIGAREWRYFCQSDPNHTVQNERTACRARNQTVRHVGTGHLCIYTAVACRAGAIDFDTYDSGYNWRTSLPTSRRRVIIPGIVDGDTATLVSLSHSG
jgi:hypothetical protein